MTLFFSTMFLTFTLGFQQMNVTRGHYRLAALTSFCIAFAQYWMISGVAHGGSWVLMGIGGALGVTLSMLVHRKFVREI